MEKDILIKLDAIASALHELAYAQAATAALIGNALGGGTYCPEDFLPGNVHREVNHARETATEPAGPANESG